MYFQFGAVVTLGEHRSSLQLSIYVEAEFLVIGATCVQFYEVTASFSKWLYQRVLLSAVYEGFPPSHPQHLVFLTFFTLAILVCVYSVTLWF